MWGKRRVRKLLTSSLSLLGLLGGVALFSPQAKALTPAGTVISNAATAVYMDEDNNKYTTTSNVVQTTVEAVCSVTTAGGGDYQGTPGQTVYVPFEVTNKGNSQFTFNLSTIEVSGPNYTKHIYLDENQNGLVDPGEQEVSSVTLGMGETKHLVVAVSVDPGANVGDKDQFKLHVENPDNSSCASDQNASVTVISDALIQANKSVDKTQAVPGDVLTYRVTFKNVGLKAAKSVDGLKVDLNDDGNIDNNEQDVEGIIIKDQIPKGATYKSGSAAGAPSNGYPVYSSDGQNWYKSEDKVPNGVKYVGFFIPDSNPTDNVKENVLDSDQEGYLEFQVTVDSPFDDPDLSVDNEAVIDYAKSDGTDEEVDTNDVHTKIPQTAAADIAVSQQVASWDQVEKDNGNNWQDDNTVAQAPAGSWVEFKHSAANRSSSDDVIELSAENVPQGWIVEFWNADGTAKLIDTDGDGKVDLGTVPGQSKKDFIVKVYIPANATSGGYVDVVATSKNNPSEQDKSRDTVQNIVQAGVDLGKVGTVGDDVNNPSDGNTDGTNDSDDVLPGDNGHNGVVDIVNPGESAVYPLEVANTGASSDQFNLSATLPSELSGSEVQFMTDPNCDGDPSDGQVITNTPLLGGTLLKSAAASGTNTLTVYDVANFSAGDTVIVGAGTDHAEKVKVQSVDANAGTITLAGNLTKDHAAGERVSEDVCVVLEVTTTDSTPPGNYNVVVNSTSKNSGVTDSIDAYLKVNEICGVSVSPDHSDQLPPSGTTTYQHVVKNAGNTDATVTITLDTSNKQLSYTILDENKNPVGTAYTVTLTPGEQKTFYVKVNAPSDVASGYVENLTVKAESDINGDNTPDCTDEAVDTTTIISGYLQLTKTKDELDTGGIDSSGACTATPDGIVPGPCDTIVYHIEYKNIGDKDALNVIITDPIPDHTTYVPGSLCLDTNCDGTCDTNLTDASGDDQAEYDAANKLVRFRVGIGADATHGGKVAPNEKGCVIFKVKIQ